MFWEHLKFSLNLIFIWFWVDNMVQSSETMKRYTVQLSPPSYPVLPNWKWPKGKYSFEIVFRIFEYLKLECVWQMMADFIFLESEFICSLANKGATSLRNFLKIKSKGCL